MNQKIPPFVVQVSGRGLKTFEWERWSAGRVRLRIDDLKNPEDWMIFTIDVNLLGDWYAQAEAEDNGNLD